MSNNVLKLLNYQFRLVETTPPKNWSQVNDREKIELSERTSQSHETNKADHVTRRVTSYDGKADALRANRRDISQKIARKKLKRIETFLCKKFFLLENCFSWKII